ncbi:hypothetical protein IU450_13160 [Nocardia abscessus]|uniref:hypothetical protein n=1 Tax=Nocardia abscessus TaxID=120957 RepID=UPI0018949ACA|nr:hypothetical protein [Nocardia abscessus]MBF6336835.1 hypothetical protein [Nocardia abscessus]
MAQLHPPPLVLEVAAGVELASAERAQRIAALLRLSVVNCDHASGLIGCIAVMLRDCP